MMEMKYLLEEAKNLNLPITKKRAILREYLQTIILNSIYRSKFSNRMFFVGGTALRFFYNLPRFSEDLDFNTPKLEKNDFQEMCQKVVRDLTLEGFSPEVSYKQRETILISFLNFPRIMKRYNIIGSRGEGIMIKLEVNSPPWKLNTESHVLSLYGYNFSAILMSKGALLSEKLLALLDRRRGRYLYDILFMLRKGFHFDKEVLSTSNIRGDPKELLMNYIHNLKHEELKRLAEQVKPFLFKEDDIELILKAPEFAEKFLYKY